VDSIYLGDPFYEDESGRIAQGTLTGVSLPAVTSASEIVAVNLASVESIDIPNLAGNGLIVTLSGLPNLKNYSFSSNFKGQYVNITNTGLTSLDWKSKANLFSMRLVGNPNLASVTFTDNANITSLLINCGSPTNTQGESSMFAAGYPMPSFSGPSIFSELEVTLCDQPSGDWRTTLDGLGSSSAGTLEFHDNVFTGLGVSNMTKCELLNIHDNYELTEIEMPSLDTAGEIDLKGNFQLGYINATTFPSLKNVSRTFELNGNFYG